jgi:hydrogenase expression/formation protein HypE
MAIDLLHGTIEMAHGSGGRAGSDLIEQVFLKAFNNPHLNLKNDQAVLQLAGQRIAMATDSHVISPLFFPGGNIGSLSVFGTVNDISMSGAQALYLSAGFILEEGFPLANLTRIVDSMADAARECGVQIVTGDTKVVERGLADGCYINTTGLGIVPDGIELSPEKICAGDKIILSGTIGDHGTCILAQRQHLNLETTLLSDTQSLHDLVATMIASKINIRCMRDPTRGGLAAILNELTQISGHSFQLDEAAIPVKPEVSACSELLGLDPLYIANEGKLVTFCPADQAQSLLEIMQAHPKGHDSAIIGEVIDKDKRPVVELVTGFGGKRIVDWRYADPLPRIC